MICIVGFGCGGNREFVSSSRFCSRRAEPSFPFYLRSSTRRRSHVPRVPPPEEAVASHPSFCLVGYRSGHWKFDRSSLLLLARSPSSTPADSLPDFPPRSGPLPSSTAVLLRMILFLRIAEGRCVNLERWIRTEVGGSSRFFLTFPPISRHTYETECRYSFRNRWSMLTMGAIVVFFCVVRSVMMPLAESPVSSPAAFVSTSASSKSSSRQADEFKPFEPQKWLASQGRDAEAIEVLESIAKCNGRPCPITLADLKAIAEKHGVESHAKMNYKTIIRRSFDDLGMKHVRPLFATRVRFFVFVFPSNDSRRETYPLSISFSRRDSLSIPLL